MEALQYIEKNRAMGASLEAWAACSKELEPKMATAVAKLGETDALRALLYKKKESIRVPTGMIASHDSMRILSAAVRLRTRVVERVAEQIRGLLPAAGTKAGTPTELAEAVMCGDLGQFKLHKLFQPEGGSLLLATSVWAVWLTH